MVCGVCSVCVGCHLLGMCGGLSCGMKLLLFLQDLQNQCERRGGSRTAIGTALQSMLMLCNSIHCIGVHYQNCNCAIAKQVILCQTLVSSYMYMWP